MSQLSIIKKKIIADIPSLIKQVNLWRFQDRTIVFTNGCFDLLHYGHIHILSSAADLGNRLVVGINSDDSTMRLKGPDRPITDEQSRAAMIASLFFVDAVIIFNEDTPLELVKAIQPDVLVKGGDYDGKNIVGSDIVTARRGTVEVISFLDGLSTSAIEEKIRKGSKV